MGFIDSYKHLEKLCGDMMNDDRRVSAYIDEMIKTPNGSFYVRSWDDDLKKLKHYRWIRNRISHEPGCTEQNMCEPEDELWLNNFYSRIMNQTDPLSLYDQAMKTRAANNPNAKRTQQQPKKTTVINNHKTIQSHPVGCATYAIITLAIAALCVFLLHVL